MSRILNAFLVVPWAPEVALRPQAPAGLRTLHPQPGATRDLIRDETPQATRGHALDAVATLNAPTTDAYSRGHQYGCAILVFRDDILPWGRRLSVNQEPCAALQRPFRHTTALAAQLIRECNAPDGVKVMVRLEASSLCAAVVHAARAPGFHGASTHKSHRRPVRRAQWS